MKVGFIVDHLDGKLSGIGYYCKSLSTSKEFNNKNNEIILIHSDKINNTSKLNNIIIPKYKIFLYNTFRKFVFMPFYLKKYNFDLVHDSYIFGPFLFKTKYKKIVTIYDMTPLVVKDKQEFSRKIKYYILKYFVKRVNRIITCSENSKQDIINFFKVSPDKVSVIYLASNKEYGQLTKKETNSKLIKYNLVNKKYIFYVGNLEKHKNVEGLIESFNLISKKNKDLILVLGGKKGWGYEDINKKIIELDLSDKIIFTGYVDEKDLPALYNGASLFVYPSYYEGFGLPPLEAMSCGCPVITSNTSSLPEVVGDAGIMVDPNNVDELAKQMERVLTDEKLRKEMIKKGLKQAKKFSWEKCARETLKVYEEVIKENKK
ncbi:MAG TPA: glycosyltransferase family 1 protein [Candidatus Nanoarchaeia archaeon]|nr:glycosyltransferase family 1 protein [Candidatus Nanoarchaeia archaeon]